MCFETVIQQRPTAEAYVYSSLSVFRLFCITVDFSMLQLCCFPALRLCATSLCVTEGRLEKNSVAAFLLMIKNMLRNHPANQESLLQVHGPPIIGAMLSKVRTHTRTHANVRAVVNRKGVWRSDGTYWCV